eukprot:COSAG01_NODE_60932_length_292_cov_0.678756_2_plen_30_part_01
MGSVVTCTRMCVRAQVKAVSDVQSAAVQRT